MYVSIVIPAFSCARDLGEALAAIPAHALPDTERIVVDDGSPDETADVAAAAGARVVRLERNRGPAAARNEGVRVARGTVVVFLDADVIASPNVVRRLESTLEGHPEIAAVFGSYDATPRAPGIVSRYRNLLHHHVHQEGAGESETFWAGCGAIRRVAFDSVGGFDEERFPRSSIEDIDLGYRLRAAGHRIRLDPTIQVTHLKRWTLASMIRTDVTGRAVPWARLVLSEGRRLDHLNLALAQRVAALCAGMACLFLGLAFFRPAFLAASAACVVAMVALNRGLFALFARCQGLAFALACVPLHVLYYLYSGLAYAYVRGELWVRGTKPGGNE